MLDVQAWHSSLARAHSLAQLFELIPGVMFFAKDAQLRIVMCNQEFAQHCGFNAPEELEGLTDDAIFPSYMASKFHADDLVVMEGGKPLLDLVELFPAREGLPEWFITQKTALRDTNGAICGVCGIVRSYERILDHSNDPIYQCVGYIRENYSSRISIPDIARKIGLSQRQLERRFLAVFRVSPRKYIVRLRLLIACDRLRSSEAPITEIVHECGFYDHSSFIRHFQATFGATPSAFRKRFRE